MSSLFAWLDTSEHDRRRAMDVIDLFQQKETVDELGIGSIRDTLADFLTPGTSTVQTRARYFFFIPWIYQALEKRTSATEMIAARGRTREIALIDPLAASDDPSGTIGIQSRASLKRLPSAVYWAGLGSLGFRLFPGSLDQFHRKGDRRVPVGRRDDSGDLDIDSTISGNWHPRLPEPPGDFPGAASFALTPEESIFFLEQLRIKARGSLLLFLVEEKQSLAKIDQPWNTPFRDEMPKDLITMLDHGQCYSELMHGAQLLYNLMLAEKRKQEEWIVKYKALLGAWAASASLRLAQHRSWDRAEFWSVLYKANSRLPAGAKLFSDRWIALVLDGSATKIERLESARRLITEREQRLKGSRARLANQDQLNLWGGASGTEQLNYRWGITKTVVGDIVRGFQG
jgi:hypothetical protein